MFQLSGEIGGSGWTLYNDLVVVRLRDSQLYCRVTIYFGGELSIVMFISNRLILIGTEF